ncbi:MAG: glutamate racemase [Chitinispirillaceae bacterium]|nr:glutamate racemase [Chitinispirillaceae bacterium]
MSDERFIGIIDSGLGGLTNVRELMRLMPGERLIYVGDTAHAPYGSRSDETICCYALKSAEFLAEYDLKMVIVSCNTISAQCLSMIEKKFNGIPVIGSVLPGVRAAVMRTAEKRIGVIGTDAAIRSQAYTRAVHSIDSDIAVYGKACPLLVPLVEEGLIDFDVTRAAVQHYVYEMIDLGVDCLILGCTHYPPLIEVFQGTVGTRIQLLDSSLWTAKEAQDILVALDAFNPQKHGGIRESRFFITDLIPAHKEQVRLFADFQDIVLQLIPSERYHR